MAMKRSTKMKIVTPPSASSGHISQPPLVNRVHKPMRVSSLTATASAACKNVVIVSKCLFKICCLSRCFDRLILAAYRRVYKLDPPPTPRLGGGLSHRDRIYNRNANGKVSIFNFSFFILNYK